MAWQIFAAMAVAQIGLSLWGSNRSSRNQQAYQRNQLAWNRYNANMNFQNNQNNLAAQYNISQFNAQAMMVTAKIQAAAIAGTAQYNVDLINASVKYNNKLLDYEESLMWSAAELDMKQIEAYRTKERGAIVATQAASGTVIGEGSNEDVVVDQMTQEALELFVVRHGADIQKARIDNEKMQNLFQGEVEMRKVAYEGRLAAGVALANASIGAAGEMAGAAIRRLSGTRSNEIQHQAALEGARFQFNTGMQQAENTLTDGYFTAFGQGIQAMGNLYSPSAAKTTGAGTNRSKFSVSYSGSPNTVNSWSRPPSMYQSLMG